MGTVKVSTKAMGKMDIGKATQNYGSEEGYQPRNYTKSWGFRGLEGKGILAPAMPSNEIYFHKGRKFFQGVSLL